MHDEYINEHIHLYIKANFVNLLSITFNTIAEHENWIYKLTSHGKRVHINTGMKESSIKP